MISLYSVAAQQSFFSFRSFDLIFAQSFTMKFVSSLAILALSAQYASAFPAMLSEAMIQIRGANEARADASGIEHPCPFKRQAAGITPPFDAAQQLVSTTGEHAFVAPSGNDQRGPCRSTIS
jgi:hypothetical protein